MKQAPGFVNPYPDFTLLWCWEIPKIFLTILSIALCVTFLTPLILTMMEWYVTMMCEGIWLMFHDFRHFFRKVLFKICCCITVIFCVIIIVFLTPIFFVVRIWNDYHSLKNNENVCCVCLWRYVSASYEPCMHKICCDFCALEIRRTDPRCPICRVPLGNIKYGILYHSLQPNGNNYRRLCPYLPGIFKKGGRIYDKFWP
jgi:hypothetical protein